jgi:signal transduction histidine kinase
MPRAKSLRIMPEPSSSLSLNNACSPALAVADELRALLAPAGELARTLAGGAAKYRPEYLQLMQLADTLGFANAVVSQIFSATTAEHQQWSPFSVDAIAREMLPMLRAGVQGKAKVTLTEDSHSPLLQGNPLELKRALLHVVLSLARNITVANGLIEIGVALITFADTAADDATRAASRRVVRLTVADNGIGMDAERVRALQQSGSEVTPLPRWEDAGLRIACSIVNAHGGMLDIESHAGMGTMVRIDLPLAWPARPVRSAANDDSGLTANPDPARSP